MDVTNFILSRRERGVLNGDYGTYRKQSTRRLLIVRKRLGCASNGGKKASLKKFITAEELAKNHEFAQLPLLLAERAWAQGMHERSRGADNPGGRPTTSTARRHMVGRFSKAIVYIENLLSAIDTGSSLSDANNTDALEVRAYLLCIKGAASFELRRWQDCLMGYAEARLLYMFKASQAPSSLSTAIADLLAANIDPSLRYAAYQIGIPRSTSIGDIVRSCIAKEKSEFLVEALRRDPSLVDCTTAKVSPEQSQTHEEQTEVPESLTWRTRKVKLEDAVVAHSLAQFTSGERKLSAIYTALPNSHLRRKALAYDNVILPCQDAADAVKIAIDELTQDGLSQTDEKMQSLQITRTAVNYLLVSWQIGRNRCLLGTNDGAKLAELRPRRYKLSPHRKEKSQTTDYRTSHAMPIESANHKLKRLREQLALYESIIQGLESLPRLAGVAADENLMTTIDARRLYFSSLRSLSIARGHRLVSNLPNALAILNRASEHVANSLKAFKSLPAGGQSVPSPVGIPGWSVTVSIATLDNVTIAAAQELQENLKRTSQEYQGLVTLDMFPKLTSSNASKQKTSTIVKSPLCENLARDIVVHVDGKEQTTSADWPCDLLNLVDYPPKLSLIPVKPIFLDVAYNYIDYPREQAASSQGSRTQKGATSSATPAGEKKKEKAGWFGFGGGSK